MDGRSSSVFRRAERSSFWMWLGASSRGVFFGQGGNEGEAGGLAVPERHEGSLVIFLRGDRVCYFKSGLPTKASNPFLRFGCRCGPNVKLLDQNGGRKSISRIGVQFGSKSRL